MLSTGAMTRLGYVYGNLMVHVEMKNSKLIERGIAILQSATGKDRAAAEQALRESRNRVPLALVMLETGVSRVAAARALKSASGNVRAAIAVARKTL
jgi:N-acetylmuramic acid 6-phosphate etherase